jgi:hypothetical protein
MRMWYNNTEYRDIGEAVLPADYGDVLDLASVLKLRRPFDGEAQKKWDEAMNGWTGPHANAWKDATLAGELVMQLGLG